MIAAFWAIFKNLTALATFWATFGKNGLLFTPTSGRTDYELDV